jgi:hypothetical protein
MVTTPMDGACDAVSHIFENVPACQSALLGNAINFQPSGAIGQRRDLRCFFVVTVKHS